MEEEEEGIAETDAVEEVLVICLTVNVALIITIRLQPMQLLSNCCYAGSGSGSYCRSGAGGEAYGYSSLNEYLFMGSGGGGGARGSQCCTIPSRGGNGGGIIIISTPVLTGDGGIITACGTRGLVSG